jgi:hypothetical protein
VCGDGVRWWPFVIVVPVVLNEDNDLAKKKRKFKENLQKARDVFASRAPVVVISSLLFLHPFYRSVVVVK